MRSKATNLLISILILSAAPAVAEASTVMRQVKVKGGNSVTLLFDRSVSAKQIRTEYLRDIIQFSIKGASVYPAKILTVDGGDIRKVFAYQYTPKLVRTRLTVKGKAEKYKDRVSVAVSGKMVTLSVKPERAEAVTAAARESAPVSDSITLTSAKAVRHDKGAEKAKTENLDAKDKEILKRVLSATEGGISARKLAGGKPLPSPFKSFLWLAVILAGMGVLTLMIRRRGVRGRNHASGRIGKLFSKLPIGAPDKMIEVLAMHHLGPKKSIAVLKVQGRQLVVGITEDSINLISEVGGTQSPYGAAEASHEDAVADLFRSPNAPAQNFGKILDKESSAAAAPVRKSGVRDEIRQRLKGMKSL